ncbi:MAG: hypothetical protein IKP46_00405 [Bacteroidales bacterium]|nr:hypothetical protein [Bacteroidales bacterium]
MKTVFISYANEAMAWSLRRIGRQARRIGIFDEVRLYTPSDLPDYAKKSPLMQSARGAGYWVWKPVMIKETLESLDEGDVVVYIDAGCTLRQSPDWKEYLGLMDKFDTVCFQYSHDHPEWEKWGAMDAEMFHWTKKSAQDYLRLRFGSEDFLHYCQVMGGILFMKGKNNSLLRDWLKIMLERPDLIEDPSPDEVQCEGFASHRHDQAFITPLALNDTSVKVLPEKSERYSPDSFVWASRIRAASFREYIGIQTRHYMRIWLGDKHFEKIKGILK